MKFPALILLILMCVFGTTAQQRQTTYASGQLARIPSVPIVLNRFGAYPQHVQRNQGAFLLYIENRLPAHALHYSLTLDQTNAPELVGLDTTETSFRASKVLDLMPGKYRLHFGDQTDVSVAIEIG